MMMVQVHFRFLPITPEPKYLFLKNIHPGFVSSSFIYKQNIKSTLIRLNFNLGELGSIKLYIFLN